MSISNKHPSYIEHSLDWYVMRDCHSGERSVKERGFKYLPATPGQVLDGATNGVESVGFIQYNAYRLRARFPEYVASTVETQLGLLHRKPPIIQVPDRMKALINNASIDGLSMKMLLRKINEEQLITGRVGLLADFTTGRLVNETLPRIAIYSSESIINWDDNKREDVDGQELVFVVLDETEQERQFDSKSGFVWKSVRKYRVLSLGDISTENAGNFPYSVGVFNADKSEDYSFEKMITPQIGGRTLNKIPFVFVNSTDVCTKPSDPPLLALANLSLAIYRGEADYRQSLFLQGQDTFVVIGGINEEGEEVRIGSGSRLELPLGGDAKFVGVTSDGLSEQRLALENDRKEASEFGGRLLDARGGEAESGEALRIRVSSKTASLNQIAQTGAAGLENILKLIAEWLGEDATKVSVTPNLDFTDTEFTGRDAVDIMTAKSLGLPLSMRAIHDMLKKKDITKYDFEEEIVEIENDPDFLGPQPDLNPIQRAGNANI